ncbi:MAG: PqqD family protein [Thermoanaerobaculia bacterium]|nr:PqqD family protein [Thermoanaerobaculia bacterium]
MTERRTPDVATRRILDETLLVPLRGFVAEQMEIFALNEVAAFVWERLEDGTTERSLVDAVVAEFEVERDRAAEDVAALLEQFRDCGLLVDDA